MARKIPAARLKKLLESAHNKYVQSNEINNDAIAPALKYTSPVDREFAALLCAIFAYGKVSIIKQNVGKALAPMGKRPVAWLRESGPGAIWDSIGGWKHRFNNDEDLFTLLVLLRKLYQESASIEKFLEIQPNDSAYEVIEYFVNGLTSQKLRTIRKKPKFSKSFWHMLPRPSSGSACKRLNLYLRWMVGRSEMDLSLWKDMTPKQLVMPLDVHVMRQAQSLGLTTRKTADWRAAIEVTNSLRALDPEDPTRFDFALCHLGINGVVLS